MVHNFVEAVVGSLNRSFQPLFHGFALELQYRDALPQIERKAHHSNRQCKRRNYVTDGHTFAELKCVSERLNFGACLATGLFRVVIV